MKQPAKPDFLSVRELAGLIGISKPSVRELINSGQLRASRIGIRKLIVARAEYERWKSGLQPIPTEAR